MTTRNQRSQRRGARWKSRALAAALLAAPMATAAAREIALDPAMQFITAREEYDAGDMVAAIARYERLLRTGYRLPELHFNLGNARFRAGDLPGAIYEYRRAGWMRPRDPDIQKNLQFALERAGALSPSVSLPRAVLRRGSESEWHALLWAFWGLAGASLAAGFLARRGRSVLRGVAAAAAVVALLSAAGALDWRDLRRSPEAVTLRGDAAVRFAPLDAGTVHFTLPAGSIIRVRERDGAWLRVEVDRREGWLPWSDVRLLRPPEADDFGASADEPSSDV